jgi:hypothetical protein
MESRGILIIRLKIRIPRFPTKPTWNPYYFIKNPASTFEGLGNLIFSVKIRS